jgi:hypothetical protein
MFTIFKAIIYNGDGRGVNDQRLFSESKLAEDWIIANRGEGWIEEVRVFTHPIPKDEDMKDVIQSRAVSYSAWKTLNDKAEKERLIAQALAKVGPLLTKEELGALGIHVSK